MKAETIIVMKVGPHSNMNLSDIILSKKEEEKKHGVHYWGYSGVFCRPKPTQEFCNWAVEVYGKAPQLILIETKSSYDSNIGMITEYSQNNIDYKKFLRPVQLQGAQFSFVARGLEEVKNFCLEDYVVVGGKNDGKMLTEHLKYRVNKSFAKLNKDPVVRDRKIGTKLSVLTAELVYPYAIWLKC